MGWRKGMEEESGGVCGGGEQSDGGEKDRDSGSGSGLYSGGLTLEHSTEV